MLAQGFPFSHMALNINTGGRSVALRPHFFRAGATAAMVMRHLRHLKVGTSTAIVVVALCFLG